MTRLLGFLAAFVTFLGVGAAPAAIHASGVDAQRAAICPGGWTHGGIPGEVPLSPVCIGGEAELTQYKVDVTVKDQGAAASLGYSVPAICRNRTKVTVEVSIPALRSSQSFDLGRSYEGNVTIFAPTMDSPGVHAMHIRATAGACSIDLESWVVAVIE